MEKKEKETTDLDEVYARSQFLALKRAFTAYKEGKFSEETLLHFFAGFCQYIPTPED